MLVRLPCLLAALGLVAGAAAAQEPVTTDGGTLDPAAAARPFRRIEAFSPYAAWNYPMRVFWGDQHVHTGWSADAGAFGCTLSPEEALRFARGEEVTSATGQPAKLSRPLDWIAVTDHSQELGVNPFQFGLVSGTDAHTHSRLPAEAGHGKGVPMGGDLRAAPAGKAPTFLVYALKDPIGGNLDRIQIVKGWLDAQGRAQEKVYDVAWSGDRVPGAQGKLPPVGDTVDVANATWTNTIGAPELGTVWSDPDFDPERRAFYYARVLQIPTPRWTAYEAKRFGVRMAPEVAMKTQERAYTSPIWYTPGS
jgi:hypothetical protein